MKRWILWIAAGLLFLMFVVIAAGAAFYFLYYKPRHEAGPLTAEALHLPADVGVVGGVDLTRVFATPLFTLAKAQESMAAGLKEVQDKLGLDVEKDLHSVAFGSWMDATAKETRVSPSSRATSPWSGSGRRSRRKGKTRQDLAGVRGLRARRRDLRGSRQRQARRPRDQAAPRCLPRESCRGTPPPR